MRMKIKVNGLKQTKEYINKQGKKLTEEVITEIIKDTRKLSQKMQTDLSASVDKGAVPFTNRAVLFLYSRSRGGVTASILIKDIQAKYLYEILVQPKSISKLVPTSTARLDKNGNIAGLKRNLANNRYKIVKKRGKERLIDVKAKKREDRVIGKRESKRRKMVYDFYRNAEKGAILIIKDVRGTFKMKRN